MQKPSKIAMLLADDSNWRCRETLRRAVERVVREALDEGWKPEDIAISLVEVADEHMDQMIGDALQPTAHSVVH
jgi:nuclear transport factor 2 (NTF2) superfamily protein